VVSGSDLPDLYLKAEVFIEEDGLLVPACDSELIASRVVHVITAWNPGHARPTPVENEQANCDLMARLRSMGFCPIRALGADPDSDHAEESWAVVGLTDDEARVIGAEFGQVAVFRFASGMQTVLACAENWERSRRL
jgi:hypothetical protein